MGERDDRTLLGRLGGQDLDRKDPLHDLACMFLSRPEQAERIMKMTWGEDITNVASKTEKILTTQTGFTVGFIDVLVTGDQRVTHINRGVDYKFINQGDCNSTPVPWEESRTVNHQRMVIVEVKISRIQSGELLRQLNLYKHYLPAPIPKSLEELPFKGMRSTICVAALRWSPSQAEKTQLNAAGVKVIRLAEGFDAWVETQAKETRPDESF